jgi:hypothetical protein
MKKTLFTAALSIISAASYCQTEATTKDGKKVILNKDMTWAYADCGNLTETKTYTGGKVMTSSKGNIRISSDGNSGLDLAILKGTGTIILNFATVGYEIKCVRKDAPGTIEFTDGSTISIKHMGDLNCTGNFSGFFGSGMGNDAVAKTLKSKAVKKVTLEYTDTKNNVEIKNTESFTVAAADADKILKTIQCLSN